MKIFAMFAFGVVTASSASIDTAVPPSDPTAARVLVLAHRADETQAQSTKADRLESASKATASKQNGLSKTSGSETDGGFCESPDDRARAHCLIYVKLRGHRS